MEAKKDGKILKCFSKKRPSSRSFDLDVVGEGAFREQIVSFGTDPLRRNHDCHPTMNQYLINLAKSSRSNRPANRRPLTRLEARAWRVAVDVKPDAHGQRRQSYRDSYREFAFQSQQSPSSFSLSVSHLVSMVISIQDLSTPRRIHLRILIMNSLLVLKSKLEDENNK